MTKTYRDFATILGEDGRWHACIAGHSMLSTTTLPELTRAIDRHYMSVPDAKAALATETKP